ncbi:hypothetical protein [Streptomyces sp. NBC_00986]|uniref:hypothetical protein n=1 Tax=Streptomyces sp. NBC_00986 TaxID=2903702 RepID=UPI0038702507|nr:hypothetical protein OG504_18385 [Streptomyces sp. NBC_00986]
MSTYEIRSGDRAAFIAGLRELADFLTANPSVLVPRSASFGVFVDAADSTARREGAEHVAAPLGVPVEDLGQGYYDARRTFGSIAYSVVAIPPKEQQ